MSGCTGSPGATTDSTVGSGIDSTVSVVIASTTGSGTELSVTGVLKVFPGNPSR